MPHLNVREWVSFTPKGGNGGGCFQKEGVTPIGNYTGRIIMLMDDRKPMSRRVNEVLQGFQWISGIQPGFPLDVTNLAVNHTLRARDTQPYISQERLKSEKDSSFFYMVIERGSAQWLLLKERYPKMQETCMSLQDDGMTLDACQTKSEACCAAHSQIPGVEQSGIGHSCLHFERAADCQTYFNNFKLSPNDATCLDKTCHLKVPRYAIRKEYKHGLTSKSGSVEEMWKQAETPSVEMLFTKALDMKKVDEPMYANSVCTNYYTGQLIDSKVYLLDCAKENEKEVVCWKQGNYNNVVDPPGTAPVEDPAVGNAEVFCTYLEKQPFKAWAVSNIGGIMGALRGLMFASVVLYTLVSIVPALKGKQPETEQMLHGARPIDFGTLV